MNASMSVCDSARTSAGAGTVTKGSASARVAASRPCVLVFAGLDPSGGAGLSADLQAIAGQGAHALTVATALTVQDNDRVYAVHPVAASLLREQAQALIARIAISAVKIGIPGSAENARAIAALIVQLRESQPQLPVVLDPVLASGHGDLLSHDDAVRALAPMLSLATVLTPNRPEAEALTGLQGPLAQAQSLRAQGCQHVLLTGGHDEGEQVLNQWFGPDAHPGTLVARRQWHWPRLAGSFHGSGCTLAAAIAGQLAAGVPLALALDAGQAYCYQALATAYDVAPGQRIPQRASYF